MFTTESQSGQNVGTFGLSWVSLPTAWVVGGREGSDGGDLTLLLHVI